MLIKEALDELESRGDLAHYAAHAAAKELTQNWEAAIRDGAILSNMLSDVDATITALWEFKATLK